MDDTYRLRVSPTGLYGHLDRQPGEPLPALRWSTFCQGYMHAGMVGAETLVVVDGGLNPKGKHAIRWVAPEQKSQPFMFRRRFDDAIALAERVLRLKGKIQ